MFPKTRAYVKIYYGQTSFLIKDDDLLEKYNTIWDKLIADIQIQFDREPVQNNKFLKDKRKSYDDEATVFHDKEIPKVGSNHACLAVTNLDSALKKDKNYYYKVLLKKWKYNEKEKKKLLGILLKTKSFSSDSDKEQIKTMEL